MPDKLSERLRTCFETVFVDIDPSAIPAISQSTVAAWDSLAHVTLMSLIGEEFGIEIDFEDFEGLTSFAAILEMLRARTGDA